MPTYVAEIDGRAILAFGALDDDDARDVLHKWRHDRRHQSSRHEEPLCYYLVDYVHPDGSPLWDEISPIPVRRASELEHGRWVKELLVSDDRAVPLVPVIAATTSTSDGHTHAIVPGLSDDWPMDGNGRFHRPGEGDPTDDPP